MEAAGGCSRPAHNTPAVTAAVGHNLCYFYRWPRAHGWWLARWTPTQSLQQTGTWTPHTLHSTHYTSLTVQPDLALRLAQGVLADALVRAVVRGRDVGDGEARVEAVPLDLLLGVVPRGADDHHLVEHPEGDGL